MQRIKNLDAYQKGLLIVMLAMMLIFAVVYAKTIASVGILYNDVILVHAEENGQTVYSGKIQGVEAEFTVTQNSVSFRYGEKDYGQYVLRKDASAAPKNKDITGQMEGIEITNGDKLVFRGGVVKVGDDRWFYSEDGTLQNVRVYASGNGTLRDENGNVIDTMEPSIFTIYELLNEPQLTHKGQWLPWFLAAFVCLANAVSILFAEELFRWKLQFKIRDAERATPSEWEMAGRSLGWLVATVGALVIFIVGL